MPKAKPPVEYFRELLALSPVELKQALTNRPPESRKALLAKVAEYKALSPEDRELRLRATELHWYLWPLLSLPAANRAEPLALIPPALRKLVDDRLQLWDLLPPDLQQELLTNAVVIRYLIERPSDRPDPPTNSPLNLATNLSPFERASLQKASDRWQQMSAQQRQQIETRFNEFFMLKPRERQEVLSSLSEPERQQIEKTLQTYEQLSPPQRAQCLRSFGKFASLSFEERQLFLHNAQRWQLMTPSERQTWKDLVRKMSLQPPLPPGFSLNPPLPPLPTAVPPAPKRLRPPMATNQN